MKEKMVKMMMGVICDWALDCDGAFLDAACISSFFLSGIPIFPSLPKKERR